MLPGKHRERNMVRMVVALHTRIERTLDVCGCQHGLACLCRYYDMMVKMNEVHRKLKETFEICTHTLTRTRSTNIYKLILLNPKCEGRLGTV